MSNRKLLDVILLKSNDENEVTSLNDASSKRKTDKYINYLLDENEENQNFINTVEQVSLLTFEYCNQDAIFEVINDCFLGQKTSNIKCLILTSRQAIESIQIAFELHSSNLSTKEIDSQKEENWHENIDDFNPDQIKLLVYCVGDSTKARFKLLVREKLKNIYSNILDHLILRTPSSSPISNPTNEHKQNARTLASLIISDNNLLKSKFNIADNYAIYPCSSIRKNDLSAELTKESIDLHEIIAYKTVVSDVGVLRLNKLIENYLSRLSGSDTFQYYCCLVFFSPSGCDAIFNPNNKDYVDKILDENKFRFISIGPSTSSKLKNCVGSNFEVYELSEPSPKSLLNKLKIINEQ